MLPFCYLTFQIADCNKTFHKYCMIQQQPTTSSIQGINMYIKPLVRPPESISKVQQPITSPDKLQLKYTNYVEVAFLLYASQLHTVT